VNEETGREEETPIPAPPEGFVRSEGRGEFTLHNGPYFHRVAGGDPQVVEHALYILPRHTNGLGLLHGGMLSAFLDGAMGGAVTRGAGRVGVTVHLSVDFLRMARRGEWLTARGRMTHTAGGVAFAEAQAFVGERLIGRASGVFKLMDRPRR
jgi:uncharacterized protein (TIGR00369 family)